MAIKGVHVVHAMPGRIRLRVDKVKGNPAFAQKAQNKLGRVPGITQVEAKPLTGSVLIYYDAAALLAEGAWRSSLMALRSSSRK
jgi:Heavy metal associated domain 2